MSETKTKKPEPKIVISTVADLCGQDGDPVDLVADPNDFTIQISSTLSATKREQALLQCIEHMRREFQKCGEQLPEIMPEIRPPSPPAANRFRGLGDVGLASN